MSSGSSCVFDKCFERGQRQAPKAIQVRTQFGHARRVHVVEASGSLGPARDKPDVFEHPQVLGNRRPRHRQASRQLSDRKRLFGE
jgi:hypothetical protein